MDALGAYIRLRLKEESKIKYGLIIENNSIDVEDIKMQLPNSDIVVAKDEDELEELVISSDVVAGFIINTSTKYEYLVKNTSMDDNNRYIIENALLNIYRNTTLSEKVIDPNEVLEVYSVPIEYETTVLGKDSMKNYLYTYILIFGLYL